MAEVTGRYRSSGSIPLSLKFRVPVGTPNTKEREMFLTPRIGGPDAYGTWTCVLVDDRCGVAIGEGSTEDEAVVDAKEDAKSEFEVGDESIALLPISRNRPMFSVNCVEKLAFVIQER